VISSLADEIPGEETHTILFLLRGYIFRQIRELQRKSLSVLWGNREVRDKGQGRSGTPWFLGWLLRPSSPL
jgi:hypothetical protein